MACRFCLWHRLALGNGSWLANRRAWRGGDDWAWGEAGHIGEWKILFGVEREPGFNAMFFGFEICGARESSTA